MSLAILHNSLSHISGKFIISQQTVLNGVEGGRGKCNDTGNGRSVQCQVRAIMLAHADISSEANNESDWSEAIVIV
jgi:hypothetical protein